MVLAQTNYNTGGSNYQQNKYLYNSKELQNDGFGGVSLDWYDYGARMYDPALGRFHTQDRFAEKYFDYSPYQYAGNNPISNIDINGDSIFIFNGGNRYLYDNGTMYTYNSESKSYDEVSVNPDSYMGKIAGFLGQLGSSCGDAGSELLGFFDGTSNHLNIKQNKEAGNTAKGWTLKTDPDFKGGDIPTENGVQQADFIISFAHEVAHKKDMIERPNTYKDPWVTLEGGITPTVSEKYATHYENRIRAHMNKPLRTHYAVKDGKGHPKTSLLNKNGTSRFYNQTITYKLNKPAGTPSYFQPRVISVTVPYKYR